jgi:hypothetical protein
MKLLDESLRISRINRREVGKLMMGRRGEELKVGNLILELFERGGERGRSLGGWHGV